MHMKKTLLLAWLGALLVVTLSSALAEQLPEQAGEPSTEAAAAAAQPPSLLRKNEPEPRLRFGNFEVVTALEDRVEYRDNIFLSSINKKSDVINILSPKLHIRYLYDEDRQIRFNYLGEYNYFANNPSLNFYSNKADLDVRYKVFSRFFINVDDNFYSTADPSAELLAFTTPSFSNVTPNETVLSTTHNINRVYNNLNLLFGYDLAGRVQAGLLYGNRFLIYDDHNVQWQNYALNKFGGQITYLIWPKTSLFAEYNLELKYFPEQQHTADNNQEITSSTAQDSKSHHVYLGLLTEPTAKVSGTVKGGYVSKVYNNTRNWNGIKYGNPQDFVFNTSLRYSPWNNFTALLWGVRNLEDANESNAIYYKSTNLGLSLEQRFLTTKVAKVAIGYSDNDYNNQKGSKHRVDDIYSAAVSLDNTYRNFLSYGVGYKYYKKVSTYANQSYDANVVSVRLGVFY